jgi:hypothetical protein
MPQWLVAILNLLGMGAGNVVQPTNVLVTDFANFVVSPTDYGNFTVVITGTMNFVESQRTAANFVE